MSQIADTLQAMMPARIPNTPHHYRVILSPEAYAMLTPDEIDHFNIVGVEIFVTGSRHR